MYQDKYQSLIAQQKDITNLHFEPNYIKIGSGYQAYRRIFKNVQYDSFENQQLKEFKEYLDSIPVEYLKEVQNDAVLLRFLYAHKFKKDETVNYFVEHLNWLNNPETMMMDEIPQYSRLVQIIARDDMLRPVLYINLSLTLDDLFIKAITNILIVMEDYMFIPGKVESWIIIIDLGQINPNMQTDKIINAIKHFITNFPSSLEHLYLLDVNMIIKQIGENILKNEEIKSFEFDDKITIIEKSNFNKDKLKFLQPEYVHLFDVDEKINQSLQNPFQALQPQQSQKSLSNALSPNQIQTNQLILNQPQPTLYGQPMRIQQNADLIGPLYPLVVYASSQPQPYVPELHDRQLAIQPASPLPTFYLDTQNQFGQSFRNIPNHYTPQQNTPQQQPIQSTPKTGPQLQNQMTFQNSDYAIRTKYDDIIDQYNWNKYGVTSQLPMVEPEKLIDDITVHYKNSSYAPPTPTLQGTEQTIKKIDLNPNHDIYSTYGHYEDPKLPQLQSRDYFPQISEHHSVNNHEIPVPSIHTEIPIKQLDFNQLSPKVQSFKHFELDPLPPPSFPTIHQDISKRFDFGPIPTRPNNHTTFPSFNVQEKLFVPNGFNVQEKPFVPDRSTTDVPIATNYPTPYIPLSNLNNAPSNHSNHSATPPYQPYTLSLPSQFQTLPQSTLPLNSGYSPYQPQPFSPLPSSTNLYTAPNYPIPATKPQIQQYSPQVVEQDGIKFQDETMVVGDHDNRQTKPATRDPALDQQQCIIF